MGSGTTRVGIRRGGMPGKAFPTVGHPPSNILMGGGSLEMMCDGNFSRLWHHPGVGMPGRSFPTVGHPPRMLLDGKKMSWTNLRSPDLI